MHPCWRWLHRGRGRTWLHDQKRSDDDVAYFLSARPCTLAFSTCSSAQIALPLYFTCLAIEQNFHAAKKLNFAVELDLSRYLAPGNGGGCSKCSLSMSERATKQADSQRDTMNAQRVLHSHCLALWRQGRHRTWCKPGG